MVSILLMEEVLDQLRLVVYPSIYNISRSPDLLVARGLEAQHYAHTSKPSIQTQCQSFKKCAIYFFLTVTETRELPTSISPPAFFLVYWRGLFFPKKTLLPHRFLPGCVGGSKPRSQFRCSMPRLGICSLLRREWGVSLVSLSVCNVHHSESRWRSPLPKGGDLYGAVINQD